MGRIAGIQIKNYGSLKNIKLGKLLGDNSGINQHECHYRAERNG